MRNQNFETPGPIDLLVEIGSGSVILHATETQSTQIQIDGKMADDVTLTQDGRAVSIVGPKARGIFGNDHRLDVQVSLPTGSNVTTRTGSAGVVTHGSLGAAELKAGSGGIEGETFGDGVAVSTGSGAVRLGSVTGAAAVKTGSGSLSIEQAGTETSFKTGSGSATVREVRSGAVTVKGASGNVTIGVPAGTPVWADASAVSGTVRNEMQSVGAPEEGQPHVELHLTTVSGDITVRPA